MGDTQAEPPTVAATAPEPEPESESGGFFGFFKGSSSKPEPVVVTEAATDSDSGGFFTFRNPWKSTGSKRDPAPEITLEADPDLEPDSGSGGLISRFKRQPAKESPSPAPAFSEKPVSDATVDAALASKPEAGSSSGGFLSKILPGGGNTPADVSKAVDNSQPKPSTTVAETKPVNRTVHFESDIKPIFESKCITCHNRDTLHGRVSLESRDLAFADTPAGRVIVPGSPDSSILFQNIISARTTEKTMPPTGHSITRKEKNLIYTWIKEGAYWPEGSSGQLVAY